jgi:hypothetical protein
MAVLLNLTSLSGGSYQIKGTFLKSSQGDIIMELQHAGALSAFSFLANWETGDAR